MKTYEISADHEVDIKELAQFLPKGLPVVELGGGVGVSSCFINNLLKPPSHVVIEADPDLISHIEKRRDEEHCRFDVKNFALSYTAPKIMFNIDKSFVASSERRATSPTIIDRIEISTIKLRDLVKGKSIVVSDIEGNEIDLINNDMQVLKDKVAYFIVEYHERISGKWQIWMSLLKLRLNGFKMVKKCDVCKICPSYLFVNKRFLNK